MTLAKQKKRDEGLVDAMGDLRKADTRLKYSGNSESVLEASLNDYKSARDSVDPQNPWHRETYIKAMEGIIKMHDGLGKKETADSYRRALSMYQDLNKPAEAAPAK
ncbi:hypothetical protein GOV09_01350 [Candidatus Woesearchaeota archaeon]|nr:hypothetical protein [Candidatus Woesearchaeota archaeon]